MGELCRGKRAYAVIVLCTTTAIALPAQTFTTLFSFNITDGELTEGALVQAADGNLYGTTYWGGAPSDFCDIGCGTIFRITSGGTLTTLYAFCPHRGCTDGGYPGAGLVEATNRDLYGTTYGGGVSGAGTVFKITPSGTLTTLYSFCAQIGCTDGGSPLAALIQATNGDFYGTTSYGGASGLGTVFKITPSGKLTTLYSFCSQSGCTDGETPDTALVQATNGDFYGTTCCGGANAYGTVFKITPSGTLTTLYSFCSQSSGCTDGERPYAALVQATNGDFYGTTSHGGANAYGTVFKITPSGTLTTLYSFCSQSGCADGSYPGTGLVEDTNGTFYGTTISGGASGDGTVFSLSVGLGPFVKTLPTSGLVGGTVKILGTDLSGATSVSFDGTAAVFEVPSSSLIITTVPASEDAPSWYWSPHPGTSAGANRVIGDLQNLKIVGNS